MFDLELTIYFQTVHLKILLFNIMTVNKNLYIYNKFLFIYLFIYFVFCFLDNRYEVLVNCTVASDQLGLSGRFCLHLKAKSLDLEDCDTQDTVHSWKYRHIQKFGYNKSTNDFLMVTRRRNKFGHGVFDFHVMGDPRKIIDSLQDKSGCSLRLADNANRISNLT